MSKAFTKEDDVTEEVSLPVRPRAATGEKRPITPEGLQALERELAALPADQTRRAQQLKAILDDVQVVDTTDSTSDAVAFGAWVALEDDDGNETIYRLVGPDEADARAGRLSVESPLARALLGRTEGDSVHFERPLGAVDYTIVRVTYRSPEA